MVCVVCMCVCVCVCVRVWRTQGSKWPVVMLVDVERISAWTWLDEVVREFALANAVKQGQDADNGNWALVINILAFAQTDTTRYT